MNRVPTRLSGSHSNSIKTLRSVSYTHLDVYKRQSKYGVPESRQLSDVVGRSTATDAWGRPIKYQPPTKTVPGWLHSSGPDARDIRDDIYVPVTWETLTRGK